MPNWSRRIVSERSSPTLPVSSVEPTRSVNKIVMVLELDIHSPMGARQAQANPGPASATAERLARSAPVDGVRTPSPQRVGPHEERVNSFIAHR